MENYTPNTKRSLSKIRLANCSHAFQIFVNGLLWNLENNEHLCTRDHLLTFSKRLEEYTYSKSKWHSLTPLPVVTLENCTLTHTTHNQPSGTDMPSSTTRSHSGVRRAQGEFLGIRAIECVRNKLFIDWWDIPLSWEPVPSIGRHPCCSMFLKYFMLIQFNVYQVNLFPYAVYPLQWQLWFINGASWDRESLINNE